MSWERELSIFRQPDYNPELSHIKLKYGLSYSERHEIDTFKCECGYDLDDED